MARGQLSQVVEHLRRAVPIPHDPGDADGELLERFIRQQDESAFELLLQRHGPMVLGVCRRVLGNIHDAEDAFQATFLILVRKANSVWPREQVASWLHGVAQRHGMGSTKIDRQATDQRIAGGSAP